MRLHGIGVCCLAPLVASCTGVTPPAEEASSGPVVEAATSLPETDIFLGELSGLGDNPLVVADIVNVTAVPGYQNQPRFVSDDEGKFYFVSEGPSGKTDIWLYDYRASEQTQITDTPGKSEYSPKPAPGNRLSFIQESEDGAMTRVHALREDAEDGAAIVDFAPLGYYEWLNNGATLGVFYRSDPPALHLVDVASGETREIFDNVGRSFQASTDGASLYVTRGDSDGRHRLMQVDVLTGAAEPIMALPGASQDFWLLFDDAGALDIVISSEGAKLLTRRVRSQAGWAVSADVSALGYDEISRVVVARTVLNNERGDGRVSPAAIAFVASPARD